MRIQCTCLVAARTSMCTNRQCCGADNAKGWLGLVLGTRMWYSFANAMQDDEAAFEKRLDNLCRELGARGKLEPKPAVAEGVPPASAPKAPPTRRVQAAAPAPEPAPAPATPPRAAVVAGPAPAPAPAQSFSPSMQMPPMDRQPGGSLAEMTTLLKAVRQDAMLEREELEAKVRRELAPAPAPELITADELSEFQARLERLEIEDEIKFEVEDLVCDFLEVQADSGGAITAATVFGGAAGNTVGKLHKLVAVSHGLVSDAALARRIKKSFT